MSQAEFIAVTKKYVEKSLTAAGKKPSQAKVNRVAAKIVKEFAPVAVKKTA